ncbi:MAG: hypothetical protein LAN64_11240 [Acidobacteriia bacterium]|nr:hypothetical protein [Terriglobia bacterium]
MVLAAMSAAQQSSQPSAHEHMQHEHAGMVMNMPAAPVAQSASGTSWIPASSPLHMWMSTLGGWQLMAHGELFVGYNQQGGPLGVGKVESQNWLMLMQERKLGAATLQVRQMLSAEPLTAPHPGYPELFQTGETYRGRALVNYQHPHDVFSELSALLSVPVSEKVTWLLYGGPAGEPALGPAAFPHRISASEDPAAPLGHHVQDSTHISYGVVTSGFVIDRFKIEASAFNGREPDERRYNFDLAALDSWSARLNFAPGRNWAAQYSHGHLVHPEALEAGNVNRQTASLAYNRPWVAGNWATTLIWGRNSKPATRRVQNSYLLESTLNFARRNYAYTRLELVDKDELFPAALNGVSYRIGAYTFGGVRDLAQGRYGQIGLGADIMFYSKPVALDPVYGRDPVSVRIFLRFRPPAMKH